ncbi:MAG: hypothetical protein L6R37_008355, partial [Teloschistes peruensis]
LILTPDGFTAIQDDPDTKSILANGYPYQKSKRNIDAPRGHILPCAPSDTPAIGLAEIAPNAAAATPLPVNIQKP